MLNKNFTVPEDMREAVISGSLQILFPEAAREDPGSDGRGNALKQIEDSGFMYLENIVEELAACLMENDEKTAAKAERLRGCQQ
jgi:hypothetical protein